MFALDNSAGHKDWAGEIRRGRLAPEPISSAEAAWRYAASA